MANPTIAQQQDYWARKARIDELKGKFRGKQEWQIEGLAATNPEAAELMQLLGQQDPSQIAGSLADSNWGTDFLGNAMWRFGENLSFGVTSGADLFTGGEISEEFGVQEWEDNSWAGRVGGIIGEGLGFVSGVGLVGAGLKKLSKGVGLGGKTLTKTAGKKIRSETAETLNKIVGKQDDKVMNDFAEELVQTGQKSIKAGRELSTEFGRKASKMDPLETFDLQKAIDVEFDDLLRDRLLTSGKFTDDFAKNILDPANDAVRREIRENSLKVAQEYSSENVPRAMQAILPRWLGGNYQMAGDIAYEATLLGLHGGIRNLVEKGTRGIGEYFGHNMKDQDYGRRSFLKDLGHGMAIGSLLAPVRHIPGGARVEGKPLLGPIQVPKSGILANVLQGGKAIIRKFNSKKATDYTPKQLQTMMRNIYYGSNRNKEFFRGVDGWTPALVRDVRMLESAENVKVLENLYKHVQEDLSKNFLKMLSREVRRDLFESFPRYTMGSLVMNGQTWIQNWDELTADEIITQYIVGAFYMKRGKTLDGKTPAKRFLGSRDIKGDEVAKLSQAFDVFGWDKGKLDLAGSSWDKYYLENVVAERMITQSNKSSPDLRNATSILEQDMVPVSEYTEMSKQANMRDWATHIDLEYTKMLAEAEQLKIMGRRDKAADMERAATDMLSKAEVAKILVNELNFGLVDKNIRPMDKQSSLDFIERLNDIELNGKKLTIENVTREVGKLRKAAGYKTTAQIQEAMEHYIKNSLDAFGLWHPSMEQDGIIRVHPSTVDLLLRKLASNEKLGEYSEAVMTLRDVLRLADRVNLIRFDQKSMEWTSDVNELSPKSLARINKEYKINTERMHDLVFNTENSGWRDLVPGKRTTDDFFAPDILSLDPLWHVIETNQLHLRNDIGMQILTGKGTQGTEHVMLLNEKLNTQIFKGKRRIVLEDPDMVRELEPHLVNLYNNLNRAWQLTEGAKGTRGENKINIDELTSLHEALSREVGSLFTDHNNFDAFVNHLNNEFVDSILDSNTSYGAKKAIAQLIQEGSPLALSDHHSGKRMVASSRAIREVILGSDYGRDMQRTDKDFAKYVREMTERYKREIEDPTKDKGMYLEFTDHYKPDITSDHSAKDWLQSLIGIESQLDASKVVDLSRVVKNIQMLETLNSSFNTAAHFEKLAKIATGRLSVEDLKNAMEGLKLNTRNLSTIVLDAMQNNDVILWRQIVDAQYDIARALNRVKQFTQEGKGSLEEVSSVLEKVTLTALNERNRRLGLDSIESVDDYIKRQTELVNRQDRTGRPVRESQTISEGQYKSKYRMEQADLDFIKGDIIAFTNEAHDLSREVKNFLFRYPAFKDRPDAHRSVIQNLESLGVPAESYMEMLVKPWMEIQWTKAKALDKDGKLDYDTFKSDTAQLLVSSWAQTKIHMGNYENGNIKVSTKFVTDWDAGFLGLVRSLGLENKPSSYMLLGKTTIAGNRIHTKLTLPMMQEMNSRLAAGAGVKMDFSDQISAKERGELEKLFEMLPAPAEGQDGRPQFQVFRLDEKQAIVLNTSTYKDIVNQWRSKGPGTLYEKLAKVVGEDRATRYLENTLKVPEFKIDQKDKANFSTEVVEGLLLTTRLLKDSAFYLDKLVPGGKAGEMSRTEVFKSLKYLKLANPSGGITLNNKTLDIMRYFTRKIMPDTPQYRDMKDHFETQMSRGFKQMTIYDEKDPTGVGDGVFSSHTRYKATIKQQLMDQMGFTEKQAVDKADELANLQRPEAKSVVDAEVFLSLPEMVAQLTSRGGDRSWFVWDGDNIVGFNTVIKPVISQSKVGPNGEISVVVNKTAFKYDPVMDAAMKDADGNYFTDSISFKSASKVAQSRANADASWVENAMSLRPIAADLTGSWKGYVAEDVHAQRARALDSGRSISEALKIVEVDRANMLLKSISGPHDGTLTMAFGNFLSNDAQGVMNSWLRSTDVVHDLNQNIKDLYANPFAFKAVAEKLQVFDKESGDITAHLTGLEAVLAEGGIPIFEHMRPQIERALVGNYLGSRNFASGSIKNGAYNVSTAGDLLSQPIRYQGIQSRFGGSGVPFFEADKPVRRLLHSPDGTESISLVFRLSKQQAADLNTLFVTHPDWINATGKKGEKRGREVTLFNEGEEFIVSGNGQISGSFDGYINRIYGRGDPGAYNLVGRREGILARVLSQEILTRDTGLGKAHYDEIIKAAKDAMEGGESQVTTLGELIRFIDGNPLSSVEKQNRRTHFADYIVTNGKGSMAEQYKYGAVRVLDTNLRTPKDGINSWVLTGIEKIIDQRRGAVSEMNSSDLINPQDADFDLDKSASFFATPGPIVREIHSASGYHEISSEQVFEKALTELRYEEPELATYIDQLEETSGARPALIRQHSLTSLMYQYFTSVDGVKENTLIRPGLETGITRDRYGVARRSESVSLVNEVALLPAERGRRQYEVLFRHGAEFIDAIQHMKKVIKHTMDIYGDPINWGKKDPLDHFWFSNDVGLFKAIEHDVGREPRDIGWNTGSKELKDFRRDMTDGFLRPMNRIFNLALGYETLSDGSTRKLTFYDHVSTFERARHEMARTAEKHPELKPFIEDFLGFLGENPGKSGISKHPLVDGLIKITDVYNTNFPTRIERGNAISNMLTGAAIDIKSKEVQDAINNYMKNEREWVRFQSLQWEINQIEGIMGDMRSRRQHETSQFDKLGKRKALLMETLGEVEVIANDHRLKNLVPKTSSGYMESADAPYAVYRVRNGDIVNIARVARGESFSWKTGDLVRRNPRTFRFTDPIQQKHLRTMARAFGTQLSGVEKFDISDERGYINSRVEELNLKFAKEDAQFADAAVKNSSHYSDLYTRKLELLKDAFDNTMAARGPQYAKQLLYRLLTPRISPNEMSLFTYDNRTEGYYSGERYLSNKMNETLVIRFMTKAMDKKVSGFSDGLAKEWWKEMEQSRKVSYLMTHDKSLVGDVFKIGNLDRGITPDFSVLPTTKVKPRFLDVKTQNEQARKTLQAYLTGSYFLDPIEAIRLTIGLDKTMNELPSPEIVGERVKFFWEDVGQNSRTVEVREDLGRAVYRLSKSSVEHRINGHRDHLKSKRWSEKLWEEKCNN